MSRHRRKRLHYRIRIQLQRQQEFNNHRGEEKDLSGTTTALCRDPRGDRYGATDRNHHLNRLENSDDGARQEGIRSVP